jgi:hypothetical protein
MTSAADSIRFNRCRKTLECPHAVRNTRPTRTIAGVTNCHMILHHTLGYTPSMSLMSSLNLFQPNEQQAMKQIRDHATKSLYDIIHQDKTYHKSSSSWRIQGDRRRELSMWRHSYPSAAACTFLPDNTNTCIILTRILPYIVLYLPIMFYKPVSYTIILNREIGVIFSYRNL